MTLLTNPADKLDPHPPPVPAAPQPQASEPDVARLLRDSGGPASRALPAEATASKGSSAYQVHTYPTKIPPAAIEPFILASTEPDGLVLDPFCGSGMTGLAALNTGRRTLLSDLSPGAVHLAGNHARPVPPARLAAALAQLQPWLQQREAALYASRCPTCSRPETLRHVVWSDTHTCSSCARQITVWDLSDEAGRVPRSLACPHCGHQQNRHGVATSTSTPVEKTVSCTQCRTLQRGPVEPADLARLTQLGKQQPQHWLPTDPLSNNREMYRRSALHLRGISTVADFWLHRSKLALSDLWHQINTTAPADVAAALRFAFTNTAWHATRMRRYNAYGGQRPLTGTLYIPQLVAEANVFEVFRHQVAQLTRFYATHPALPPVDFANDGREDVSLARAYARRSSATDLSWLPNGSVDYVFTDPPFGANLFYADCNIVWEAWLGSTTDTIEEIVVNRSLPTSDGGKTLNDYQQLLSASFVEAKRVLKPGARASIVFHNADDQVWSALLAAAASADLLQTDVSVLDKTQRSMKGYKGRSGAELVPFYDLVVTYTAGAQSTAELNGAGEIALAAVRAHLADLPDGDGNARQRSLEYLYSLSVGAVIKAGARPKGLSFRALEQLLCQHLVHDGRKFSLP